MSVRLTKLHHRFGSQKVLDDVDLHLRPGDIYGFIGHNGAGKTTALRIAMGLLRPSQGEARIDGHDPVASPRCRALIGGLVERPGFFDHWSGRKNLRMLARLSGDPAHLAKVDKTLALLDLEDAADKPVGHYSQGMRQRLGLAQALLGEPRYLLLDEPTNGLDPRGIHDLRRLLRRLAESTGVTILLSSHLLAEVADLCTRIAVLHQGRMLVEAPTESLLQSQRPRFRLDTDDNAAAAAQLTAIEGVEVITQPDGVLQLCLSATQASDLVSQLVAAGRQVHSWNQIETSLEQLYLDFTRDPAAARAALAIDDPATDDPAIDDQATTPSQAPAPLPERRGSLARVQRYEATRLCRPLTVLALSAPSLVAGVTVFNRHLDTRNDAEQLAAAALASASDVTAFEALGRALQTGLPLLGLMTTALASQTLAAEFGTGTLRNLLLRPLYRAEIVLGKWLTLLACALLGYLLLLASGTATAAYYFDFADLVEILGTNGKTFPLLPATEVWPELWSALASPLLPLIASVSIGLLCSALTRSATGALALAGGSLLGLELLRAVFRKFDAEAWLPGPYLPSPLANNSHIDYFVSFASGASNAANPLAAAAALLVPLAWAGACIALCLLRFRRRYVP